MNSLLPFRAVRDLMLFLLLNGLCFTCLTAQETKKHSIYLEANVNYIFYPVQQFAMTRTTDNSRLDIFSTNPKGLSVGVGLRKVGVNNWYSRYALVGLSSGEGDRGTFEQIGEPVIIRNFSGQQVNEFNLRLRYERGRYFLPGRRFQLGLGVMADPFIDDTKVRIFEPTAFPMRQTVIGLDVGLVPQILLNVGQRVRVSLEAPTSIFSASFMGFFQDSPFIPEEARRSSQFTFDVLQNLQAGLSVQIAL